MKNRKRSILIVVSLFIFDAFIFNQGLIAGIVLLIVIFWFLPRAIYFYFKNRETAHFFNVVIYALMALFVFTANHANNKIAKHRAERLIAAVHQFKENNNKYPSALAELVPEYIEAIPLAKYTLIQNRFHYIKTDTGALLYYVALPPFGRPTYGFEERTWKYID